MPKFDMKESFRRESMNNLGNTLLSRESEIHLSLQILIKAPFPMEKPMLLRKRSAIVESLKRLRWMPLQIGDILEGRVSTVQLDLLYWYLVDINFKHCELGLYINFHIHLRKWAEFLLIMDWMPRPLCNLLQVRFPHLTRLSFLHSSLPD